MRCLLQHFLALISHVPTFMFVLSYGSMTVYVDGTENAADIDERDSTYMIQMAKREYIAVTVDYGKSYLNSCALGWC